MDAVDETYEAVVSGLPPRLWSLARRAPVSLGLTKSPEGGWAAFVPIHPNRELVYYAAEGLALSPQSLRRYQVAHHAAGFYGIVADRISDRQAPRGGAWLALRAELLSAWKGRLVDAVANRRRALATIAAALRDWRRGRQIERHHLRPGALRGHYGHIVLLKLGWISATARRMLMEAGARRRARYLGRAYHLFLCALQLRDDLLDAAEDARLTGIDVATALGVSPGGMVRAASALLVSATAAARRGALFALADWMDDFARQTDGYLHAAEAWRDEITGMALAGQIGESGDRV
jgi:hypothetical protein